MRGSASVIAPEQQPADPALRLSTLPWLVCTSAHRIFGVVDALFGPFFAWNRARMNIRFRGFVFAMVISTSPTYAWAQVGISVRFPRPPMPICGQPVTPHVGYARIPGFLGCAKPEGVARVATPTTSKAAPAGAGSSAMKHTVRQHTAPRELQEQQLNLREQRAKDQQELQVEGLL